MEWSRSKNLEWVRWLAMLVIASQLFVATASAQEATPEASDLAATTEQVTPPDAETPEPTPTATPAPRPYLAFALTGAPECLADPDQPAELASGGSIDYRCTSQITIDGEALSSGDVTVAWTVDANMTPGWSVQLLPPALSTDAPSIWGDPAGSEASFAFEQFSVLSQVGEAGAFSGVAAIDYRVRINRVACQGGAPELELSHVATVIAPETSGVDLSGDLFLEPLVISPVLAPVPVPAISFGGPLDFGLIEATARGLNDTRLDGELSVTVSGLDEACGAWTLQLSASPIVDENGAVRDGFALLIGECNLTDSCAALHFEAGPDAEPVVTQTVIITLQTPQYAALGALGTTIDATLIASADGT